MQNFNNYCYKKYCIIVLLDIDENEPYFFSSCQIAIKKQVNQLQNKHQIN